MYFVTLKVIIDIIIFIFSTRKFGAYIVVEVTEGEAKLKRRKGV